jgi:ABC-type amino acid transport substrate-binding protein
MRAPLHALLALVLIGLALAPVRAAAQAEPDRGIVMAVRADAPPFAWRDPATGILRGFLYDLCVAAVVRTDFFIASMRAVLPEERDAIFEGRDASVDLLCDPTTISLARLRAFAARGLEFSPIVFVANGSYVANPDRAAGARAVPLDDGACLRDPGAAEPTEGAALRRVAAGFVRGTTGEATLRATIRDGALRLAPGEVACPVVMESHWDAARAFCDGALGYYFGDEDILRSALALARADDAGCALAAAAPNPLSYEPYAFVLSDRTPGFRVAFEIALYEVFLTGKAEHVFAEHFPGRSMSAFLETLFRINRIPPGEARTQQAAAASAGEAIAQSAD